MIPLLLERLETLMEKENVPKTVRGQVIADYELFLIAEYKPKTE